MRKPSRHVHFDTRQKAFEEIRARVFKDTGAASIHEMNSVELLQVQMLLGLGSDWGVLAFPKTWVAPGSTSQKSWRTVDIRSVLQSSSMSVDDEELTIRTVVAATLLALATPVFNPRYTQYLKPSTICFNARKLVDIAIEASRLPARSDGKLLARLPPLAQGNSEKQKRTRIELERLTRFAERGLWSDVPSVYLTPPDPPSPLGDKVVTAPLPKKRPYLPVNDVFLAEAGFRVAWFVEKLGPTLLRCGRGIKEIRKANLLVEGVRETQRWRRTELSKIFLKDFAWVDSQGNPILEVPFPMLFSGMGKGGKFAWPPRTMSQVRMLLRILQSAHLFISLLSTGGRISELLSLQPGCITESPDGIPLMNGRTYKLSVFVEGKQRDWPLPTIAVQALKQQEELSALVIPGKDNEEHIENEDEGEFTAQDADFTEIESIWTREGGSGERIDGEYNKYLRNIVKIFGLTEELGEGNLHAHRFRKTTARLIALAIIGAPKILMDLFGHKQIGMTLHYILADPVIRAEMLEVARAQTIMLAKTAIDQIEECGGPAAKKLQAAVKVERFRMGSDFGDETMQELAETFTINGRYWQIVRPGVLCTKGPQVAGACTPTAAMPEPSRCRAHCDHRLELAALKDDVDKSISLAVKELRQAAVEDDEMKAEMWRGQILTNIGRFEELRSKWETHPVVVRFLKRRDEVVTNE